MSTKGDTIRLAQEIGMMIRSRVQELAPDDPAAQTVIGLVAQHYALATVMSILGIDPATAAKTFRDAMEEAYKVKNRRTN